MNPRQHPPSWRQARSSWISTAAISPSTPLAVKLNKRHYGTMIDYFGAQKDIKEKVLRVLHNLSFVEDPTRVLRAIRFEQRFGFKIGTLTLALIKNAVKINCFKDLSSETALP